jgi:tRNA pseudouridine55 synthase
VDKPVDLTSHDVVAAVRRALGGPKVGHTGTLDPMATGVLPLLIGKATRLAQFLRDAIKVYEAHVRFGWSTDTYDAAGTATAPEVAVHVSRESLVRALAAFRGPQLQRPPAFSAKKVAGHRAYTLARRQRAPELPPVPVHVHALDIMAAEGSEAVLRIECSAGFYVRALAHDLGQVLGCGAHLSGLRRVVSGRFTLGDAVAFETVLSNPAAVAARIVPAADVLPELPALVLSLDDMARVRTGQDVVGPPLQTAGAVRLLAPDGALVALARCVMERHGALHPVVVLM